MAALVRALTKLAKRDVARRCACLRLEQAGAGQEHVWTPSPNHGGMQERTRSSCGHLSVLARQPSQWAEHLRGHGHAGEVWRDELRTLPVCPSLAISIHANAILYEYYAKCANEQ